MTTDYSIASALRYLRRPYFPAGRDRLGEAALRHLLQLLFLSLAIVMTVSSIVGGIITGVLGEVPENANTTVGTENPMQLLLYGLILAPIVEELLFRSWLRGRLTCILGLPALACLFAVAATAGDDITIVMTVLLAAASVGLLGMIAKRFKSLSAPEQKAARWRLFPVAFYGSALAFALLHLLNYEAGLSSPIMLLAVLPQAAVGLILGYVCMRFGLLSAILFHALYNLVLIGLFFLAQSLVPIDAGPAIILAF